MSMEIMTGVFSARAALVKKGLYHDGEFPLIRIPSCKLPSSKSVVFQNKQEIKIAAHSKDIEFIYMIILPELSVLNGMSNSTIFRDELLKIPRNLHFRV